VRVITSVAIREVCRVAGGCRPFQVPKFKANGASYVSRQKGEGVEAGEEKEETSLSSSSQAFLSILSYLRQAQGTTAKTTPAEGQTPTPPQAQRGPDALRPDPRHGQSKKQSLALSREGCSARLVGCCWYSGDAAAKVMAPQSAEPDRAKEEATPTPTAPARRTSVSLSLSPSSVPVVRGPAKAREGKQGESLAQDLRLVELYAREMSEQGGISYDYAYGVALDT
jgi:hypothetical protein